MGPPIIAEGCCQAPAEAFSARKARREVVTRNAPPSQTGFCLGRRFFCAISPASGCRACTSRHLQGNGAGCPVDILLARTGAEWRPANGFAVELPEVLRGIGEGNLSLSDFNRKFYFLLDKALCGTRTRAKQKHAADREKRRKK